MRSQEKTKGYFYFSSGLNVQIMAKRNPLVHPDPCVINVLLCTKVCLTDNPDLKKTNKKKQALSGTALLPAYCAV
jgi:hypothetical protein